MTLEQIDPDKLRAEMEALDPDDLEAVYLFPHQILALLDQIDREHERGNSHGRIALKVRASRVQAWAERDEWRQTAKEEHAAALDMIGVVKVRDQRIEEVRDTLLASDDGTEYAHDHDDPTEGHDACPGCWAHDIRRALDKKV